MCCGQLPETKKFGIDYRIDIHQSHYLMGKKKRKKPCRYVIRKSNKLKRATTKKRIFIETTSETFKSPLSINFHL